MKKFLKVFVVTLLVICAVGGTVYFFFRNIKRRISNTGSIVGMLLSEKKVDFNNDLNTMNSIVNSDGTDSRLSLLITTNTKLDDATFTLCSYIVDENTNVNNKAVAKALRNTNSSRMKLNDMMKEYNIKKDSEYFNRHLGANDFYEEMSNYLVNYATFVNLLNDYVFGVDKNVDIKFSVIDLYTNVVVDAFSSLEKLSGLTKIQDVSNIDFINCKIKLTNTHIENENKFSINNNKFIEFYNKCNKQEFANNLKANVSSVSSITESSTNVQIATYYFKLVFGA